MNIKNLKKVKAPNSMKVINRVLAMLLITATLVSCGKKSDITGLQSNLKSQESNIEAVDTKGDKKAEATPSPTPTPAPTPTPEYNFESFDWASNFLEPLAMVSVPILILFLIGCIREICCPCWEH